MDHISTNGSTKIYLDSARLASSRVVDESGNAESYAQRSSSHALQSRSAPKNSHVAESASLHFRAAPLDASTAETAYESDQMNMTPVISDNVLSVGYEGSTKTLRVAFRSGGVYDYFGIEQSIFDRMLQPHPWRSVGRIVKAHPFRRVAG